VYSMTGYASKSFEFEDYTIFVQIKSLNNKFLEIKFKLPVYMENMEEMLRRMVRNYVKRGKVEITFKIVAKEQMEFKIMKDLLDRYLTIIHKIEAETEHQFQASLSELLSLKSIFSSVADVSCISITDPAVKEIFIKTIEDFQSSRYIEGENTRAELEKYIHTIQSSLNEIETVAPSIIEKYKGQLQEKISELINERMDETRIMIEVGIFANKVDISEEISRIRGHLNKMLDTVNSDGACGRELDFISQEINREINTIGAKVPDYSVSEKVVEIKTNLEKIKEQVRNIE